MADEPVETPEQTVLSGVLPVSLRSRLRARWRWIRPFALVFLYLGIGAALWALGWGVVRLPWLAVDYVAVVGATQVDGQLVLEQAQVQLGSPLFAMDVNSVVARVRAIPWVMEADVRRHISGRVDISIMERTPVGIFRHGKLYLMDSEGYFTAFNDRLPPNLPIITGLDTLRPPQREILEPVGRTLALVAELEPLRDAVSEVSLSDTTRIELVLSPVGALVALPRIAGRDRLVMVASVIAHHPDLLRQAAYLDARFMGHVSVSLLSPVREKKTT
jgi:cell division septal protein FtsQ